MTGIATAWCFRARGVCVSDADGCEKLRIFMKDGRFVFKFGQNDVHRPCSATFAPVFWLSEEVRACVSCSLSSQTRSLSGVCHSSGTNHQSKNPTKTTSLWLSKTMTMGGCARYRPTSVCCAYLVSSFVVTPPTAFSCTHRERVRCARSSWLHCHTARKSGSFLFTPRAVRGSGGGDRAGLQTSHRVLWPCGTNQGRGVPHRLRRGE